MKGKKNQLAICPLMKVKNKNFKTNHVIYLSESNSELYEMLRKVDPITAERLHPNNRRKVIRSLTIFHTTNKPQSEIIREASALPAPSETGKDEGTKSSIQRYNPFFIWVDTASLEQLDPKLDARVDEMVDRGLLNEVAELKSKVTAVSSSSSSAAAQTNVSFERGIFQSIGLRQFWDVTAEDAAQKNKKYTDALESMKACTRRYARQQHRWIKNRLEKAGIPLLRLVVAMDGSSSWKDSVLGPALRETKSFLEDAKTPGKVFPPLPCPLSTVGTEWKKYNCDVCRCQLNGENEWTAHLKSKKHKHFLKLERKRKRSAADEGDENGEESIKRPAREEKI